MGTGSDNSRQDDQRRRGSHERGGTAPQDGLDQADAASAGLYRRCAANARQVPPRGLCCTIDASPIRNAIPKIAKRCRDAERRRDPLPPLPRHAILISNRGDDAGVIRDQRLCAFGESFHDLVISDTIAVGEEVAHYGFGLARPLRLSGQP